MTPEAIGAVAGMLGMLVGIASTWGALRSTVRRLETDITRVLAVLEQRGAQLATIDERIRDQDQRTSLFWAKDWPALNAEVLRLREGQHEIRGIVQTLAVKVEMMERRHSTPPRSTP